MKTGISRLVASLAIAGLALAGCTATPPAEDEHLALTVSGATTSGFDTIGGTSVSMFNNYPIQAVYDSLFVWNEDVDDFDPRLAEWTLSDDKLELTLDLRQDVDFTDGVHFDAEGLKTVLDGLMEIGGGFGARIASYKATTEVTGEYQLVIHTELVMNHGFFEVVALTPIPSPDAVATHEDLVNNPVGSGPYTYDAETSTQGVEMHFVKKEDYWRSDAYPYDEVTVKTFADPVASLTALRTGQIDATLITIPSAAEAEAAGLVLHTGSGQARILFIGDRAGVTNPAFGDVRVRKAMTMAFDREAITESIDLGYGQVSSQPFIPGQPAYLDDPDAEYPYDLDEAKKLMAEAGYADGFDLVIPTGTIVADFEPIVQQSLGDIGIRVTFESFPDTAGLFAAIQTGQYPVMMLSNYFVNTVPIFLAHGGLFSDKWDYHNDKLEELLVTIDEGSPEETKAAYQELGELINEEVWYIPFSQPATIWASVPTVDVTLGSIVGNPLLSGFTPVAG
jgi:peptide/nickel transport system substrate-binding protein